MVVTNFLCQTKRSLAVSKIDFCVGPKLFEEALNTVKVWGWLKKFGPAQNMMRPVKGQDISSTFPNPTHIVFLYNCGMKLSTQY